jgi:hypothetical protein
MSGSLGEQVPQPEETFLSAVRVSPLWARFKGGGWYFALTILSAGILSSVPFWHAARRLHRPGIYRAALIYTAAGVLLVLLAGLVPRNDQGEPLGATGSVLNTIYVLGALAVLVAACIQLRPLRAEVFGRRRRVPTSSDPVIARALASRAKREKSRELADRDPVLATELGIGRPDLGRGYDDGGLINVNTAPAPVIARVGDVELGHAEAIVAARAARGGTFFNLGEVLVDVDLPPHVQDQLRERAIF